METRLHYYYKSPKCGKTDDLCVKCFSSAEFKKISERKLQNQRSDKRCTQATGNLSFAKVEDISVCTKENNNVRATIDVIWLAEHTRKSDEGVHKWADRNHSKETHDKLKNAVANASESKTQVEILLEVMAHRSGYFHVKELQYDLTPKEDSKFYNRS
ncbi:hypothetical protein Cgig2_003078 [Carnegiea gigantea]|uniref:Uncharacterized protein n=1 Tax=Carnegiea gigantea TaxID=171969 RepID=A0A9Q1KEZ2_9CARY|nr:hypothetical protein Cgig2_003078 [Carnegiea gigantea]